MLKKLCALTLAIALAGCATVGEEFDIAAVDKLQPGVATVEDAIALLGPYSSQAVNSEGMKSYGWSYARVNGLRGKTQAKAVRLVFGADGKLMRKATSQNNARTGT